MRLVLALLFVLLPIIIPDRRSLFVAGRVSSTTWQSTSPFQIKPLNADWGTGWAIRGSNWRHHVRQKFVPGAPFDEPANRPMAQTHSYSTCSDLSPAKRNGLSSPAYHLPEGTKLPAIITADFSFIISEACVDAKRPHCASIELWLLEGVPSTSSSLLLNESSLLPTTPQQPYMKGTLLSDSAVWPGAVSTTTPFVDQKNQKSGYGGIFRKSSISFSITRPPFKLQFRDRRGACLEVVNASLLITSCYVGSARKLPLFNASEDATTSSATSTSQTMSTTLPPIGMTTPSQEELLSTLECKCPVGYRRAIYDRCQACPPETFSNVPHANPYCTPCPYRSTAPFAGSDRCVCEEGAFRADSEDASVGCTSPPSGPRQLIATYYDVHTVSINWTEPEDLGGRTDIYYQVHCVGPMGDDDCPGIVVTRRDAVGALRMADIKSRESLETSFVTIRVTALNGVSNVAAKSFPAKYFEAVITLRSSDADAAYAHIPDRVFILIGIFGGAGLVAAFFVVYGLVRHFRDRRRGQPMIVIASSNSEDGFDPNKAKLSSIASDDDHPQQPEQQQVHQPLIYESQGDDNLSPSSRQNLLLIQSSASTDDAKVPLVDISPSSAAQSPSVNNNSNKNQQQQQLPVSVQISPSSTNEAQMSTSASILSN